jgi:hypothetical protein
MSSEMADSSPLLTESQRNQLRGALRLGEKSKPLTSSQRQVIRQVRIALGDRAKRPEQLLVAFKAVLNEVANDVKLPAGEERSALIDQFVSAFIEELYKPVGTTRATADGEFNGPAASEGFTPGETPGLSDARP